MSCRFVDVDSSLTTTYASDSHFVVAKMHFKFDSVCAMAGISVHFFHFQLPLLGKPCNFATIALGSRVRFSYLSSVLRSRHFYKLRNSQVLDMPITPSDDLLLIVPSRRQ